MNALTKHANMMMDPTSFELMQRVAKVYAMSPLFPEALRKPDRETALANAILVLNMANRLSEDPLTVAQNIYFVGGRPGWSASYMIGKANQHGVFKDPIDWVITGEGETLSVKACATLAATGKRVSVTCDMKMAKAEGWTKNAKYQSMPQQMLRYRSATFMIRLYCPEVMIGVPAAIEHEMAMRDVSPDYEPVPLSGHIRHTTDGEVIEAGKPAPEPKPAKATRHEAQKTFREQQKPAAEVRPERKAPEPELDLSHWNALYERIGGDVLDGASGAELATTFAAEIEGMRVAAPGLHARLMEELGMEGGAE